MPVLPEDRRTRVERASRRRVRATLIAGIALVVGGLLALGALVLGTLGPQLWRLERIGGEHAETVAAAIRLRQGLDALERDVLARVTPNGPGDVRSDLKALQESAAALEPFCRADEERSALKRLRDGLLRVTTLASRVDREGASGDRAAAATSARELAQHAGHMAEACDELVRFNADEVRAASSNIHRALLRVMISASALALLVMGGALVLLRQALHAVDAHEALVERHEAELAAFASRAAHELRTPLHTIGLALHVLRKHPGQLTALDRADASARRLAQTIDDILRFSRSGGAPDPGAVADAAAVVDTLAAELAPRALEAGLELVTDAARGLEVAMAEGHLHTVLQNLVENALKYGRSAGGRVTVRASGEGQRAVLAVADTGPGIPHRALPRLFEPFFRASNEAAGYGLGLATVKRLVDAHGGTIRVESAPGAGTTVTVELPRVAARQRGDPAALSS